MEKVFTDEFEEIRWDRILGSYRDVYYTKLVKILHGINKDLDLALLRLTELEVMDSNPKMYILCLPDIFIMFIHKVSIDSSIFMIMHEGEKFKRAVICKNTCDIFFGKYDVSLSADNIMFDTNDIEKYSKDRGLGLNFDHDTENDDTDFIDDISLNEHMEFPDDAWLENEDLLSTEGIIFDDADEEDDTLENFESVRGFESL